jgi:hypothetical protein
MSCGGGYKLLTNKQLYYLQIRPHVFIVTGNADGTVLIDWSNLSVERPLNLSIGSPCFEVRDISANNSRSIEKTATC